MEVKTTGRRLQYWLADVCWWAFTIFFCASAAAAFLAIALFLLAELHCKWSPEARRCVIEYQRAHADELPLCGGGGGAFSSLGCRR